MKAIFFVLFTGVLSAQSGGDAEVSFKKLLVPAGYQHFSHSDEVYAGVGMRIFEREEKIEVAQKFLIVDSPTMHEKFPRLLTEAKFNPNLNPAEKFAVKTALFFDPRQRRVVLEQAKLEHAIKWGVWFGGGVGAFSKNGEEWHHKPFVSVTKKLRVNEISLWVSKGGIQMHYSVHLHKH